MQVQKLFEDGAVSIMQIPHPDKGYLHVFTKPTHSGLLYYVGWRGTRRTKTLQVLTPGFRNRNKAIQKLFDQIKKFKIKGLREAARDHMAERIYEWEETHVIKPYFSHERLSREQILSLVYRVYGDLKINPPNVEFIHGAMFCYFWKCERNDPIIIYTDVAYFRNRAIILHEIAHHLADIEAPNLNNHGAIFMKHYLWLLVTYGGIPLENLIETIKPYKIKYRLPEV